MGELINVGGAKGHNHQNPTHKWEVLDVTGKAHKYTGHDLNSGKPFPIESNTVAAYYMSMTLEHIRIDQTLFVLQEIYRTLEPKGIVRIVVPDIIIGMKMMLESPEGLKAKDNPSRPPWYPETDLGYFMPWIISFMPPEKAYGRSGHQNMFDWPTLYWWLTKAGFNHKNVRRMKYNNCSKVFEGMDIARYQGWALYCEGMK